MNAPEPPADPPGDDTGLIQLLQSRPLRPAPAAWREDILRAALQASAPPVVRLAWYRSWKFRAVAALWFVALILQADTWRRQSTLATAQSYQGLPMPPSIEEYRALLANTTQLPPHFLP